MRTHDVTDCCPQDMTGLAEALVFEIADLLGEFASSGKGGAIDLRGLPMTETDRAALAERLGRGEVQATVHVSGRSEVWETAYAGVWWVRHLGPEGQIVAEQIAVTLIPQFLASHPDDVHVAARKLRSECPVIAPGTSAEHFERGEGTHA